MIRITAKRDGFRRAGITHSKTPTDYADKAFTAAQLAVLRAEPLLVVEQLPDPVAKPAGKGQAPAGKAPSAQSSAQ